MASDEVIEVNSPADLPDNIFDGKVRTLKYPSGMTMIVGTPRDLDHVFPRETPEQFEARLESEWREIKDLKLPDDDDGLDPIERWLS